MSRPVKARRLTQDEGTYLLRLVRRGRADTIRYRRALMILASSSGTAVPAIARLVAAHPDTVRDVIHAFNAQGLTALEPHWAGGRPRRIGDDDVAFVVSVALMRPKKLGLPFTHWSLRKLAGYVSGRYGHKDPDLVPARVVRIGRERVRRILHEHGISFQRTRTWKESTDPAYDAKLERIEDVMTRFPDRVFAFDQFGPLSIRPCHGACWARTKHPDRLPVRVLLAGPAGAVTGPDAQRPELVEREDAIGKPGDHFLDPVQLGVLGRVGGLLPGPGALKGDVVGVQDPPHPFPADPHDPVRHLCRVGAAVPAAEVVRELADAPVRERQTQLPRASAGDRDDERLVLVGDPSGPARRPSAAPARTGRGR